MKQAQRLKIPSHPFFPKRHALATIEKMKFPIINISATEFARNKGFDITYKPTLLIDQKDLESNFLNQTYFDCNGDEYLVTGYTLFKKEWNILFLLQNSLRPLIRAELHFVKKGEKLKLETLRSILLEKIDQYWFLSKETEKLKLENDLKEAITFRNLMEAVSEIIDED